MRTQLRRHRWWLWPLVVAVIVAGIVLLLWSTFSSLHTAATGCAADNGKGKCSPGWAINIALPVAIGTVVLLSLLARFGVWEWQEWWGGRSYKRDQ